MKKGHEMRIRAAENGGHIVEHHTPTKMIKGGMGVSYEEPKPHVFGASEKEELLDHIHSMLGGVSEADEEADEEKVSPGIHKKVAKMEKEK